MAVMENVEMLGTNRILISQRESRWNLIKSQKKIKKKIKCKGFFMECTGHLKILEYHEKVYFLCHSFQKMKSYII